MYETDKEIKETLREISDDLRRTQAFLEGIEVKDDSANDYKVDIVYSRKRLDEIADALKERRQPG